MEEGDDYLKILQTLRDLPYNVGRKLLVEVLQGNTSQARLKDTPLAELERCGCLAHLTKDDIMQLISRLLNVGLIEQKELPLKKWLRVLSLTEKGYQELENPQGIRPLSKAALFEETPFTEEDTKLIDSLAFFLQNYNLEQARAIVSESSHILCVAGAGSGKTTVLTKRIEFLVRFKSIAPEKILAITFTKKARAEMASRLIGLGISGVHIETFNSFSEKILQKYWTRFFREKPTLIAFRDKIKLVRLALERTGIPFTKLLHAYFSPGQKRTKSEDELFVTFVNDCFSVIDYYKQEQKAIDTFHEKVSNYKLKSSAALLHAICVTVVALMEERNLRDYGDQVKDALRLFTSDPALIPTYEHVLVDEYQDVNAIQVHLLDVLKPDGLFMVGDPRQAIFGWRGSKVQFIQQCKASTTIILKKNYRSHPRLVHIANTISNVMGVTPQAAGRQEDGFSAHKASLQQFPSEEKEFQFVAQQILQTSYPKEEVFVLARTNRQLADLADLLRAYRIPLVLKTDETKAAEVREGHVTLATVHAIKGLEAQQVFVIGCNAQNFPCKVGDHPVIEALNLYDYDRHEEERRLFYVAVTRAKQQLFLTYTGSYPTAFLDREARRMLGFAEQTTISAAAHTAHVKLQHRAAPDSRIYASLRDWRRKRSQELGVPAYRVLNNRSLEEISHALPVNKEELETIYGLGPSKIARFGQEILQIVNKG